MKYHRKLIEQIGLQDRRLDERRARASEASSVPEALRGNNENNSSKEACVL